MRHRLQTLAQNRGLHFSVLFLVVFSLLAGMMVILPHQKARAANNTDDILLVHGYNNGGIAPCNIFSYMPLYRSTLGWQGNLNRLYYYNQTDQCNANLQNTQIPAYDTQCQGYPLSAPPLLNGATGTTQEMIEHIACRLAWYIWDNYTSKGRTVRIIAHSMGGIVVRWALYGVETGQMNFQNTNAFPSYLSISRVVTVSSPHNGSDEANILQCGTGIPNPCDVQAQESSTNSSLLKALRNQPHGIHPDPSPSNPTYWTTIGTDETDDVVSADQANYMASDTKFDYLNSSGTYNHLTIMTDGVLTDNNGHQTVDTTGTAPVKECPSTCSTYTDFTSIPQSSYYRPLYNIYLHITDSLVPPTPTPLPPTTTPPPNATATPLPPPPSPCSASLNPQWVYENSNTVNQTYTDLRGGGSTFNLTVQIHFELQSYDDTNGNYCGSMRTLTEVTNVPNTCTATQSSYCSIAGDSEADTHYRLPNGAYADLTATNSGTSLTGFTTTTDGVMTTCASGSGYFSPQNQTLPGVTVGIAEHCRKAPTCANAPIAHLTTPINLTGHLGTLGVYLEEGQTWTGTQCLFNNVLIAVAEMHLSNGASTGRVTATIFDTLSPPAQRNHQDTNFSSVTYADATTTASLDCGHAQAILMIGGVPLSLQTGVYCG